MCSVLITGSSGQIGTNLGLRLLDDGRAVDGIDNRRNGWTDRILTTRRDLPSRSSACHPTARGWWYIWPPMPKYMSWSSSHTGRWRISP